MNINSQYVQICMYKTHDAVAKALDFLLFKFMITVFHYEKQWNISFRSED